MALKRVFFSQLVTGIALRLFPASIIDDVAAHALQEELAKLGTHIDAVTVRVTYDVTVDERT